MKLVAPIKLAVSPEQKQLLLDTIRRVNEACDWLAGLAFEEKISNKILLQKLHYAELRSRFGLSSQMAVRAIAKVCEVYCRDRKIRPEFRPLGAVQYDQRIYSFRNGIDQISILTLYGRIIVPVCVGDHQRDLLGNSRGQADLIYRNGKLFLYVSVEMKDETASAPNATLGVDLGIANISVDSDGEAYVGDQVKAVRDRYASLRQRLQAVGSKSAKRHLKKLSGKERRFQTIENHRVSKRIVAKARDTGRRIAIEDLGGIRDRVTVGSRRQRRSLHRWAFYQLRAFLTYKALRAGVVLIAVDPRNTSRTCPECGLVDKANRRTQAVFECIGCGFRGHADHVGARNIATRADVNQPIVSDVRTGTHG